MAERELYWSDYYDMGEQDAEKNIASGTFGGLTTTAFSDVPEEFLEHYVCGYNHRVNKINSEKKGKGKK